MELYGGCATDIGSVREVNQDAVLFKYKEKSGMPFAVMAVCDGVGGLEHGELASALVRDQLEKWFDRTEKWIDIPKADAELLYSHLKDAVESCNAAVREMGVLNGIRTGTTLSLLLIIRDHYYIIQIGDSRIYRCDADGFSQLTLDASVARMKNGRMKNYLSNYIGKSGELWFTSSKGKINAGDLYIVCSDGFYHNLTDADIRKLYGTKLTSGKIEKICGLLINEMKLRGETDNISVGIVTPEPKKKRLFGRS